MSFIRGINNGELQGIQIVHDSSHRGYIGMVNDSTSNTSTTSKTSNTSTLFSIETSNYDTTISSSHLVLQIQRMTIPSLQHDDESYRELVVTNDGRIISRSSNNINLKELWFIITAVSGIIITYATFVKGC